MDVKDEEEGNDEPEIKMIRMVNSNSERVERFICEMCSTILQSLQS